MGSKLLGLQKNIVGTVSYQTQSFKISLIYILGYQQVIHILFIMRLRWLHSSHSKVTQHVMWSRVNEPYLSLRANQPSGPSFCNKHTPFHNYSVSTSSLRSPFELYTYCRWRGTANLQHQKILENPERQYKYLKVSVMYHMRCEFAASL